MSRRIYVWEGNGVSSAYHDDGTLVVLAESPEDARETMRREVARYAAEDAEFTTRRDAYLAELDAAGQTKQGWFHTEKGAAIWALCRFQSDFFDGELSALDREPDAVIELDGSKWVAFNGGSYD